MQGLLFAENAETLISDESGEAIYYPAFLNRDEGDRLFTDFLHTLPWKTEHIRIAGQTIPVPRLSCWFGDAAYTYSGITMQAARMTSSLADLRQKVQAFTGQTFNSVLCNFYRNQNDSVAWHADDEPELGMNPCIASISLGASRKFILRHKKTKHRILVDLSHGSLLVMAGALQHNYLHCLPKLTTTVQGRINLTFRKII